MRTAVKLLLWLNVAVIFFHLSIVLKIIPYETTWGGRLKTDSEMYVFEATSILINLVLGLILLIKGKYVKQVIPIKVVNLILWIFLIIFGLNTIANTFAKTHFEKYFAILTLAFSVLMWIILRGKNKESSTLSGVVTESETQQ